MIPFILWIFFTLKSKGIGDLGSVKRSALKCFYLPGAVALVAVALVLVPLAAVPDAGAEPAAELGVVAPPGVGVVSEYTPVLRIRANTRTTNEKYAVIPNFRGTNLSSAEGTRESDRDFNISNLENMVAYSSNQWRMYQYVAFDFWLSTI